MDCIDAGVIKTSPPHRNRAGADRDRIPRNSPARSMSNSVNIQVNLKQRCGTAVRRLDEFARLLGVGASRTDPNDLLGQPAIGLHQVAADQVDAIAQLLAILHQPR